MDDMYTIVHVDTEDEKEKKNSKRVKKMVILSRNHLSQFFLIYNYNDNISTHRIVQC